MMKRMRGEEDMETPLPAPSQSPIKDPAMFGKLVYKDQVPEVAGYTVVDVETTGTTDNDRIVQIAAIKCDGAGNELERFTTIVNPGMPIHPEAAAVHGITDQQASQYPSFKDGAAAKIAEMLGQGQVFVAHNRQFDERFVERELKAAGIDTFPPPHLRACTLEVARLVEPDAEEHRLEVMCEARGIQLENAHDAMADTAATAAFARHLIQQGIALEACEFNERDYFDYRAIGDTRPISEIQKRRFFGMCASAGLKNEHTDRLDYAAIKHMLHEQAGHDSIDQVTREQIVGVYRHLEQLIEARKDQPLSEAARANLLSTFAQAGFRKAQTSQADAEAVKQILLEHAGHDDITSLTNEQAGPIHAHLKQVMESQTDQPITDAQKRRFFGMCASAGLKTPWNKFDYPRIKGLLRELIGHDSIDNITRGEIVSIYAKLEAMAEERKAQ